jgi:hypothetical protein
MKQLQVSQVHREGKEMLNATRARMEGKGEKKRKQLRKRK